VGLNKIAEVVMAQRNTAVAVEEEGVTGGGDKNIALMTEVVVMVAETMTAEGGGGYDRSRPAKRRNYGVTVRVRGIPFSTTEDELADFFQEYSVCPYNYGVCVGLR